MSQASKGLEGIVAGQTAVAIIDEAGGGLQYRGYRLSDLTDHATFEEVAHLLLNGHLPTEQEYQDYLARLAALRDLPGALKSVLEQIPASAHPMDVLRTGVSMLGCLEPEGKDRNGLSIATRLVACLPSMLMYWYQVSHEGKKIDVTAGGNTIAAHFLSLLGGGAASATHQKALDVSLILYAEHEFNASTFTARTVTSTLSDFYSAITGAIFAVFIITVAAAEVGLALAIVIRLFRNRATANVDEAAILKW